MINRRRSHSGSQALGVSRRGNAERALLISQRGRGSNHLRHARESVRTSRFSSRTRESCCNFYGSIAAEFCCAQCGPFSSTLTARLGQRQMQPEGVPECREVEPQPQVKTPGRCTLYGRSTYEDLRVWHASG